MPPSLEPRAPGRASRLASFTFAFALPFRSARLILSHRRLLAWSAAPAAITLGLYALLLTYVVPGIRTALLSMLAGWGLDSSGWLAGAVVAVAQVGVFILSLLAFSALCTVVASPFNDFLAEAAEPYADPPLPPAPRGGFGRFARGLAIDLGKSVCAMILAFAGLLLSLVPVLNLLALALSCLLLTFQFIGYPQTRRGLKLRDAAAFLKAHRYAALGFGVAHFLLFAIPLAAPLVLPVAVVGGTLLVARAAGGRGLPPLR